MSSKFVSKSLINPWCHSLATSPNGCTGDAIGVEWLGKSFIPQATSHNKSGKPILLILDGHSSHETLQFINLANKNNILVLCLPPPHNPQVAAPV